MKRKELIDRWFTPDGLILLGKVINAFSRHGSLNDIEGLSKIENRWDLRGAPLSDVVKETTIGNVEHQLKLKSGSLKIKNYCFDQVDFSYAEISNGELYKCTFQNCEFTGTQAKEMHIYACNFDRCEFQGVDFSYSFINKNIAADAGSFTNCSFYKVNLKECVFTFPIIENCVFEDCKLYACNFDGSRLRNVRFIGKVDSPWFNGYSIKADRSVFWLFNRVDPKELPNLMYNVDFSEAELLDVAFGYNIDLSNCIFPKDEERYLYINHLREVSIRSIEIIRNTWKDRDREIALDLMEGIYFSKSMQDQKSSFVSLDPQKSSDIEIRLFKLFREVNATFEE